MVSPEDEGDSSLDNTLKQIARLLYDKIQEQL